MILIYNSGIKTVFTYLSLVSVILIASAGKGIGFASQQNSSSQTSSAARELPFQVREWFAFGSGCKASSKSGDDNLQLQQSSGERLTAQLELDKFILNVPRGSSGVRECAIRLTVEPLPGFRLKDISVKVQLQATKVDSVQLRSRVLLLLGDRLLAQQEWDLLPNEFARYRNHELYLVPGLKAEMSLPSTPCGKAQIVGLDFTFEGVTHAHKNSAALQKEDSFLRLRPDRSTQFGIFFERCR